MGLSSHSCVSATVRRATSPWCRGSLRNVAPCRRASSSANWKPALCRVRAYSVPGFPNPTISLSGSPVMSLTHPGNAAGRFGAAEAAGGRSAWASARRLLLAALLLGSSALLLRRSGVLLSRSGVLLARSTFLLLLAFLGVASGRGAGSTHGGSGSRRARWTRGDGCSTFDRYGGGLGGNRLGLLGTRRVDRRHRCIALRELRDRNSRRQRNVRHELGVVQAHPGHVELQELRQILRQAGHFDVGAHVRYDAAFGLHARGNARAPEVDRQTDTDLLVLDHALQVNVHDKVFRRMHLHILDDRLLGTLADLQPHDRRVETLIADHGEEVLLIENQSLGVLLGAVQDGGDLTRVTQAAARTLALRPAGIRAECERNTHYLSLQ